MFAKDLNPFRISDQKEKFLTQTACSQDVPTKTEDATDAATPRLAATAGFATAEQELHDLNTSKPKKNGLKAFAGSRMRNPANNPENHPRQDRTSHGFS